MDIKNISDHTWNNSLRNSIVIHVFILLIAWLFKLQHDPKQTIDTQYAVTVSFQNIEFNDSKSSNSTKSAAAEGSQRPKSEAPQKIESSTPQKIEFPKVSRPKPTPSPPTKAQPTDPVFSQTTTEESEIQAIEEEMVVDDPEPEYVPQASTEPVPSTQPVVLNPNLPSIEDIIGDISDDPIDMEQETNFPAEKPGTGSKSSDGKGTATGDPSLKDGPEGGTGKGDSGKGKGNGTDGNDNDSGIGTGDHGEGEFDASGDGIFGRKVIYRDPSMLAVASSKSGVIIFKVCISRQGMVKYIEIDEKKTTIKDTAILRAALESLRKYKYEVDFTAPAEQCGNYTLKVDNYKGLR